MKKITLLMLIAFSIILSPMVSKTQTIEEKDLPHESDSRPVPDQDKKVEPSIVFEGYVNSRDVTIVANVMGCVYYFCKEAKNDFCSDVEGVLIVSGAETGRVPEILKELDQALENQEKLMVKLSENGYYSGIRKIMDIRLLNRSI